jgi:hypothetical protein
MMTAKSKRNKKIVTFKYEMTVEVRPLKIERLASLGYLDVEKLSRATKAEFEVADVVADKKRYSVRATVRNGIVTGLQGKGCAGCKPVKMSPQLRELLAAARRRVGTNARRFQPIPIREFLKQIRDEVIVFQFYWVCTPFFCIICVCTDDDDDDGDGECICDYFIRGRDYS